MLLRVLWDLILNSSLRRREREWEKNQGRRSPNRERGARLNRWAKHILGIHQAQVVVIGCLPAWTQLLLALHASEMMRLWPILGSTPMSWHHKLTYNLSVLGMIFGYDVRPSVIVCVRNSE